MLSGRYRFVDSLDVLLAVLDSIRAAGADIQVLKCGLTKRRIYVQIAFRSVARRAETLPQAYISPFIGARQRQPAGLRRGVPTNSETGHGSFPITPRLIALVCSDGYTVIRDAVREVHVGGQLGEGVIHWSADTHRSAVDLIAKQAADATSTFLTTGHLTRNRRTLEACAGTRIADARSTVRCHYRRAGQRTAGGIPHAVTESTRAPGGAYSPGCPSGLASRGHSG